MRVVDLNVRALTMVTQAVVPFMTRGAKIINVSSIAAFCPTPRMTVYSASKAYVSAFTGGIAALEDNEVASFIVHRPVLEFQ